MNVYNYFETQEPSASLENVVYAPIHLHLPTVAVCSSNHETLVLPTTSQRDKGQSLTPSAEVSVSVSNVTWSII